MKHSKNIHYLLYSFCRYFSALVFLMYATAKIIGTQFYSPNITYDQPIGQLTGFQLTWFYFGYSKTYGIFIAISQVAASLLLMIRKTVRLGILLFLSIIINIVVMDFAYDIQGAKIMAITLFISGLILLSYEFKHYFNFFYNNNYSFHTLNVPNFIIRIQKLKWPLLLLIVILIGVSFYQLKQTYFTFNELSGTWRFQGVELKHKSINFEIGNNYVVYDHCKQKSDFSGTYTISQNKLQLTGDTSMQQFFLENEVKDSKGTYINSIRFKRSKNQLWIYGKNQVYQLYKVR